MENFGNGSSPFETPETGANKSDTKDKKKKSKLGEAGIFEHIRDEDKKHKAEKDLAKSLDNMPLFERINVDSDKPKGEDKTAELPEQAAEKPSAEAAPERLTDDETREAQQRIARDHLKSMEQADPAAAEELAPAKDFLERVEAGDNTDEAFKEAAAEAGLDEAETADALATEASTENEPVDNTDETVQYSSSLEGDPEETSFDTNADDEGEFSWRSGSGSGSSTSGGGPGSAGGQSGGGAGPGGPGSPGGPFGPGGIPGGPGGPGYGPNVGPNAGPGAGFNVMPAAANTYYVQRSGAGDFLLGGLVGYLIGRRRGRIKTEKRLKPIQKRLEKQVNALEKDITSKEQQLVAAKAAKQAETAKVQAAEGRVETLAKSGNRTVEKSRVESRLGLTKPEPAEKLGHVAMIAEKLPGAREKTTEKVRRQRPNNIRQAFRPEDVKTLQRRELLELSEKILVEGASLRSIFESNLVGEKQLRHLVAEYLAGKDIRDELRHEMVEHEIDFNRDPLLRDRVRSQVISDAQTSGLTNLLQKAGVLPEEAAVKAAKAAEMARHEAAVKAAGRQSSSKAAAIAMGTAIVVLALLVIYLLLRG